MGPSGTFFTTKELVFCRDFASWSATALQQDTEGSTYAEKEPLEVGRHLENLAIVHLVVADE